MSSPGTHPCEICGYDRTGLPGGVCPECGRPSFQHTERARQVVADANRIAIQFVRGEAGNTRRWLWPWVRSVYPESIAPWQLLLAILDGPMGIGRSAVGWTRADEQRVRDAILKSTPRGDPHEFDPARRLPLDRMSRLVVRAAIEHAFAMGHTWVGTEHLLLALCTAGDGLSRRSLRRGGCRFDPLRAAIQDNAARVKSSSV